MAGPDALPLSTVPPHKKDACQYSTELSKQFLTLTTAGLAFLVASYFAGNLAVSPATLIACFIMFGLSAALGLLFLMSVIGNIDQEQCYDVYSVRHRCLAGLQILAFVVGIVLLALATLRSALRAPHGLASVPASVAIQSEGATVLHEVLPGRKVTAALDSLGRIVITIEPQGATDSVVE